MSSEKRDKNDLVSLKELREITSKTDGARNQAAKPPTNRRTSSFIDDADSLLSDIRSVVEDEVSTQAARIQERQTAAEARLMAQKQMEAEERRKEIEGQLAVESARRKAAAEDREVRRQRLEAKEKGTDGTDEEAHTSAEDEVRQEAPTETVVTSEPEPPPAPKKGVGFYLAVVGLPIIAIAVGAVFLFPKEEKPKAPKVTVAAPTPPAPVIAKTAPPIPEPVAKKAVAATSADAGTAKTDGGDAGDGGADKADRGPKKAVAKAKKRRRSRKGKRAKNTRRRGKTKRGSAKKRKKKKEKKKFKINLGEDGDIF